MDLHTVLTGEEFNRIHSDTKFYKVLNDSLCHNGFIYKEGLNVDTHPFTPTGTCSAGGLYFCEEDKLINYLFDYGSFYATVSIPNDALVYKEENKFKTSRLILHNIQPINESILWLDTTFTTKSVQHKGNVLKYVKDQTEEICRLAVQQNGCALMYVKEQKEELCRLAVKKNGFALQYVNEQTEELCRLAVQQNGIALQFVKKQTEKICRLAVQQDGCALMYVKEQTEELCRLAVQQYGRALKYVKEQFKISFNYILKNT